MPYLMFALTTLAQTAQAASIPAAASAPAAGTRPTDPAASQPSVFHFSPADWLPAAHDIARGITVGVAAMVIGLVLMVLLREVLRKVRLSAAATVLVVTVAIWAGLAATYPLRFADERDSLTLWLQRLFAALITFVILRALDRLVIVPILTRGGKLEAPLLLHQIVNIVFAVFAVLFYGSWAFGWNINSFLAGSAVVSIVLGLALQETLGNFFSGLVMQGSPPFAIGDYVVIGNFRGRVVDMNWRAVTIHMNDDNRLIIPNATVSKSELINMHSPSKVSARYINVGVDYDHPPCDVLACLKQAALEAPGVLQDPEPVPMVTDFGDFGVIYTVKFWLDEPSRFQPIEAGVRQNIWYRLREREFSIPYPHEVQLDKKLPDRATQARDRLGCLDHVPLLSPLTPEQKLTLAEHARDLALGPGQTLFKQGDPGETFYIIKKGKVDVIIDVPGGSPKTVATLGPREFFGEMSLLTGQPRTATIRAAAPLALVEVSKADLQAIFAADASILERVSEIVARRNAEREAVAGAAASATAAANVAPAQQSLMTKMMRFFGLGR